MIGLSPKPIIDHQNNECYFSILSYNLTQCHLFAIFSFLVSGILSRKIYPSQIGRQINIFYTVQLRTRMLRFDKIYKRLKLACVKINRTAFNEHQDQILRTCLLNLV